MSSNTEGQSKLLKIIGIGEAELQRGTLNKFGEINYLQNHPIEKNDLIVKYFRLNNAIEAFENLKDKYCIVFVPTKHNSDEINDFYARDANITLNMFKIKSPR